MFGWNKWQHLSVTAAKFCLRSTESNVNVVKSFAHNANADYIFVCNLLHEDNATLETDEYLLQQVTALNIFCVNATTNVHDEWFIIVSHNGHYNHMFISFLLVLLLYRLIYICNEGKFMQQCCVHWKSKGFTFDSSPFLYFFFFNSWCHCVFKCIV